MEKTNTGLVEYAIAHIMPKTSQNASYWNGTFGQVATQWLLDYNTGRLPSMYTPERKADYIKQFGKQVFDCIGLIKGYLWSDSITGIPVYQDGKSTQYPDVDAGGMRGLCKEKGSMDTMPDVAGILVFIGTHHIGVYIGGGQVVEAKGFAYGVAQTNIINGGWDGWGKCPYIDYAAEEIITEGNTMKYYVMLEDNTIRATASSLAKPSGTAFATTIVAVDKIQNNYGYSSIGINGVKGWVTVLPQYSKEVPDPNIVVQPIIPPAPVAPPAPETVSKDVYNTMVSDRAAQKQRANIAESKLAQIKAIID